MQNNKNSGSYFLSDDVSTKLVENKDLSSALGFHANADDSAITLKDSDAFKLALIVECGKRSLA